jgi:Holliday junction resolvase-like predicted endonuclease
MNIEANLLIALLRLTKDGPVPQETIKKEVRVPQAVFSKLLRTLQNDGLIYVDGKLIETNVPRRLDIAIRAMKSGADVETVSDTLEWREFEAIAAVAFEDNAYHVRKNVRFKQGGRRWEVDVVGYRRPFVVCIDCKHWHHRLSRSAVEKIVDEQIARVYALMQSWPSLARTVPTQSFNTLRFVPVILSLITDEPKFCKKVPIVSILRLQDFINHLPTQIDSVLCLGTIDVDTLKGHQKHLSDVDFSVNEPN